MKSEKLKNNGYSTDEALINETIIRAVTARIYLGLNENYDSEIVLNKAYSFGFSLQEIKEFDEKKIDLKILELEKKILELNKKILLLKQCKTNGKEILNNLYSNIKPTKQKRKIMLANNK